jgi:hypothetical protein
MYMIMLLFVYVLIFPTCLPHTRENIATCVFLNLITSFNMMPSNCIHLPASETGLNQLLQSKRNSQYT